MDDWVSFYSEVFGFTVFQEFDEKDIATQYSALRSKVARDPRTQITMPINEPYVGLKKSQIQEYLDYYRGSGIQHIAIHTDDIVGTVQEMRDRGVEFLTAPGAYYDALGDRAAGIDEDLDRLRSLQHPHRPRRRRLPAADLHAPGRRPPDAVLRGHPAQGLQGLRQGKLQGAVRVRSSASRRPAATSRPPRQALMTLTFHSVSEPLPSPGIKIKRHQTHH